MFNIQALHVHKVFSLEQIISINRSEVVPNPAERCVNSKNR